MISIKNMFSLFLTKLVIIFFLQGSSFYSQNNDFIPKRGGICFRVDDNKPMGNYLQYSEVFNIHGLNFSFALNLGRDDLTTDYFNGIREMQDYGHELMDHTPWHRTNYFFTILDVAYYHNHAGVHRISGNKIELKHLDVNLADATRNGSVSISGNEVYSQAGIFSNFSKFDCYLYFPTLNQLVFIEEWVDNNTVVIRDIWRNSIYLGNYQNIQFYNFDITDVHLTIEAIQALAEESIRLSEHYDLDRPSSWIQPGGYFPRMYRNELKQAISNNLGYESAGVFTDPSLKVFNEYDPTEDKQFGMDWGDFNNDTDPLDETKTIIANGIAKHQLLIGSSHFIDLLGGWEAYIQRVDDLLTWCNSNNIPVKTYKEWADILYNQTPDPYENVYPPLNIDLDNNNLPDGYDNMGNSILDKNDGAPEINNYSLSINQVGTICNIEKLAGIEKGENEFSLWTKGSPGNFIEVDFEIGSVHNIYKFAADSPSWTKYNLAQSINGLTELFIPENISIIDITIKCTNLNSGTTKISGMSLYKKYAEVNLDITVLLEGAYFENKLMTTSLNNFIPNSQPFNTTPWNYYGDEFAENISSEIVDWVLISLYEDIDNENPYPISPELRISRAALLRKDGKIVDLDGISPITLCIKMGDYYIKVEHRNHLPILSANKIIVTQ